MGVSTQVYPERGLPELTGDARVDRWREHRAKVRAELVEATINAIDELGPDLSIDDVLKSAGISRPKLYRFFTDKEALFAAVAMRVQELVVERVVSNIDLSVSLLELFRSGMAGYVELVDERPNLVRFLLGVFSTRMRHRSSRAGVRCRMPLHSWWDRSSVLAAAMPTILST